MVPSEFAPSAEHLSRAAAAGDGEATQQLMLRYHGQLQSMLRRKVGKDWNGKIDPDDLLQETLIGIAESIHEFAYTDEDSFFRWAARIADHRFIDKVRYWRRSMRAV